MIHLPANAPGFEASVRVQLDRAHEVAVSALKASVNVFLYLGRKMWIGHVRFSA
jgi:hypothetical protein